MNKKIVKFIKKIDFIAKIFSFPSRENLRMSMFIKKEMRFFLNDILLKGV